MNIMYAADDGYAEIAGVSIESLLDHNRAVNNITIYFVEDSISETNKERLRNTVKKYDREIVFIPKPDIRSLTGTSLLTLRWSDSAFSRLFLNHVFKDYPDIHKVLYLDCDTLIVDNLENLWKEKIDGYLGGAVYECMGSMHKRILGAKKSDVYINTGVMLLNVDKWKEDGVSSICSKYIKHYGGRIEYVDQGVINGTISNRLKILNPRYNLTALSWDFSYDEMQTYRKPMFGYDKVTWEQAKADPAIIHFTTSFLSIRPWFEGSKTPWTKKWLEYKSGSEWKGEPLRVLKDRVKHDKKIEIFGMMPRKLAVGVAGVLHSYAKPIAFVIKNRKRGCGWSLN